MCKNIFVWFQILSIRFQLITDICDSLLLLSLLFWIIIIFILAIDSPNMDIYTNSSTL